MKWILGLTVIGLVIFARTAQAHQRVMLTAADGVKITGDFYPARGEPRDDLAVSSSRVE